MRSLRAIRGQRPGTMLNRTPPTNAIGAPCSVALAIKSDPACRFALGGLGFFFGRCGSRARIKAQRNARPAMTRSRTTSVDDVCELEPNCELSKATTISVPIVTVVSRPPARKARRIPSGLVVWKASTSTTMSVGQNAERTASRRRSTGTLSGFRPLLRRSSRERRGSASTCGRSRTYTGRCAGGSRPPTHREA